MSDATTNTETETPMPKPSIFVLGPSIDNAIEPFPVVTPEAPQATGRREIAFDSQPTSPGGTVNLVLKPPLQPDDVLPINVYAFFFQPVESVPAPSDRTTDFFFKSGAPSGSIHIGAADADGKLNIKVSGVKPSLQPYFVQSILEFLGN